ncbi:hypothetical protein K502DRAFT_349021 [Neoconidiobolus thromboides FSU 785]|nr:hypothetical protein K502DRAFT_349021 [Neoconidiobolus thromboides FSU 785]
MQLLRFTLVSLFSALVSSISNSSTCPTITVGKDVIITKTVTLTATPSCLPYCHHTTVTLEKDVIVTDTITLTATPSCLPYCRHTTATLEKDVVITKTVTLTATPSCPAKTTSK